MRRFVFCIFCLLLFLPAQHPDAASKFAGRSFIIQSDFAPFPHPARARGYRTRKKYYCFRDHYNDSSVLIRPARDWSPERPLRLVVYLHGWRNHVRKADAEFKITEQFDAAGLDAVLIVPQLARSAEDSFAGKFEDPGGFDRFIADVRARLARAHGIGENRMGAISRIVLAGHSGAYRSMAKILAGNRLAEKVDAVYLFDGMYGFDLQFRNWLRKDPRRRFATVFTRFTRRGANRFANSLDRAGFALLRTGDGDSAERWAAARVLFLKSRGGHDETVYGRRQFYRLLRFF